MAVTGFWGLLPIIEHFRSMSGARSGPVPRLVFPVSSPFPASNQPANLNLLERGFMQTDGAVYG